MSDLHSVVRITPDSLKKILNGDVNHEKTCVIKFYSQNCHYCKALVPVYHELARQSREDKYFFACNVNDLDYDLDEYIELNGVPTIIMVTPDIKQKSSQIKKLQEPMSPDAETWYTPWDIEQFINTQKE